MSGTLDKDRKVLGGFAAANNAKSKIKPSDSFNGLVKDQFSGKIATLRDEGAEG